MDVSHKKIEKNTRAVSPPGDADHKNAPSPLRENYIGGLLRYCASPLLHRFDNPFFELELLRLSRRVIGAQVWLNITCLLLTLIGLFTNGFGFLALARQSYFNADVAYAIFCIIHLLFCFAIASKASYAIFFEEQQSGTLELLMLLPMAPREWLSKKLIYPLYLLFWVWLPFALWPMLALACGFLSPVIGWGTICFPLLAGLGAIALGIIAAPDLSDSSPGSITVPAPSSAARPTNTLRATLDSSVGMMGLFYFLSSWSGFQYWLIQPGESATELFGLRRFYDFFAPAVLYWVVLNLALWTTALIRATATLSPARELRVQATAACWSALSSIYYTGLGFGWNYLAPKYAYGLFLAFPVGAIISSRLAARREPNMRKVQRFLGPEWEIAYLARFSDNAVFLKDIRSQLNRMSLRRGIAYSVLGIVVVVQVINLLASVVPGGIGVFSSGWVYLATYFVMPGMLAAQAWQVEARGMTLPMLLLSPMPSISILCGRIYAGFTVAWVRSLPVVLATIWLIFHFSTGRLSGLLPASVALIPVMLAFNIWTAGSVPDPNLALDPTQKRQFQNLGEYILLLVLIYGLVTLTCVPLIMLAPPLWALWPIAIGLFLLNAVFAAGCFLNRLKLINRRRVPVI